jgi:hypothetical protein
MLQAGLSFKLHLSSFNLECFFKYVSSPSTALGGYGLHPHLAHLLTQPLLLSFLSKVMIAGILIFPESKPQDEFPDFQPEVLS